MPELPEVVTVTRFLNSQLPGRKIEGCQIWWPTLLNNQSPQEFCQRIQGQRIQRVFNKAKYIIFELENEVIISHLRMEGRWAFERKTNHAYKESILEAEIQFADDLVLRYYDLRRFGTLAVCEKNCYLKMTALAKLGPEANDPKIDPQWLNEKFQKLRRPIKVVLLDQTIISGIGNIYANEILFATGLNPHLAAQKLTVYQCEELLRQARLILNQAIEKKGTTVHSFESQKGVTGQFQNYLKVHGRFHKKCYQCQALITKEMLGGRGTYFCPNCQKATAERI